MFRSIYSISVFLTLLVILSTLSSNAGEMKYLVKGTSGPISLSPRETSTLLKDVVIPSFEQVLNWEKQEKITGGIPVGERTFLFIVEASSNEEVDKMLRSLPIWGGMEWEVIPLQSFKSRESMEKNILSEMQKNNN